jgi:hypothetical protein
VCCERGEIKKWRCARARTHLLRVLLERIDVHTRTVLRHRLDDHSTNQLDQPLLPTITTSTSVLPPRPTLLPLLLLPLPPLLFRRPFFFFTPRLGSSSSLEQRTLFFGLLRSGCRGDDSGHLGFLARDARLFDLREYEVVGVGVVVGHDRGWRRAVLAVSGWRPRDCDGRGGLDEVVEPGTLGEAVFGGWGRWSCPVVVGLLRVVLGAEGLAVVSYKRCKRTHLQTLRYPIGSLKGIPLI